MFRLSVLLRKRDALPRGYSRHDFFKKLHSPRATKPWRDRKVTSPGAIEVSSSSDVVTAHGDTLMGNLTTTGPLGMRSPHHAPFDALNASTQAQGFLPDPSQSPSAGHVEASAASSSLPSLTYAPGPYGENAGRPQSAILSTSSSSVPGDATTLPFGKALDLTVVGVKTYEDGPVPIHLQHLKRSKKEVAESILLPRHINQLFHKIMGWSEELVELEANSTDTTENVEARDPEKPRALQKKWHNLADKMKYGVLLDAYENDKFALEHKLELAGNKMERKFLEWEGMHVLDQDAGDTLPGVRASKSSIVMETPSSFHIPVVNRDSCPGCGALLQDRSEDDFGYVAKGQVERYVLDQQQKVMLRAEYATRMAELQAHWEKHGRRVGEEWLDFMTQDEFNAFYRDRRAPFVCHRCHALENLGVEGRRKVWSAPDFTEKLRALKEQKMVVVLVVDITDFPGSMVYDLPGLISMNNDVIIAVNKMDCVRNRSFQYNGKDRAIAACLVTESYVRRWVLDIATQFGLPKHQIKDVVPLSAKRGWNMEKLILSIENAANLNLRRPHKPLPTYVVGVANTGKSSLINAMAHHLYIPQPPHPQSKKVYFTKTDTSGKEAVFWRWHTPPNVNRAEMLDIPSRHDKKASKLVTVSSLPGTTVSTKAVRLSLTGRRDRKGDDAAGPRDEYLFDTPGLLPHWHHHSPLTLLQMRRTLIRKFRNPQCFLLSPGHTLFLGGLAAVDIIKGPPRGLLFMVYTSHKVRNGVSSTERSNQFWEEQLGKALEPPGSLEQLLSIGVGQGTGVRTAALSESRSYYFECYNKHRRRPKADIYVCGLGWLSFCVSEPADVVLRVRTLPGVVHGVREPLRFKDLRAFRHWPKLKRRFTSKAIDEAEEGTDHDSINTVVRLTAGSQQCNGATETPNTEPAQSIQEVRKAIHPHHNTTASAPFEAIVQELQSTGKI